HVEPVGWQRPRGSIVDAAELELQGKLERFARASRFNTDLLAVCDDLKAARRIEIEAIKYDFLAHRPDFPATVIVCKPVRSLGPQSRKLLSPRSGVATSPPLPTRGSPTGCAPQ